MVTKIAILVDGGFLRASLKNGKFKESAGNIEKVSRMCARPEQNIFRILYYDCKPFSGNIRLPVSGETKEIDYPNRLLPKLAKLPLFATRVGELKHRGFERIHPLGQSATSNPADLTDQDFKPKYEQKGVDMRIGLDMAIYAANRAVDSITLVTNDTDFIPAMKHVRRSGLQLTLVKLPNVKTSPELLPHCDHIHEIKKWPELEYISPKIN